MRSRPQGSPNAWGLAVFLLVAATGCGKPPAAPSAPAQTYVVRGEIVRLPDGRDSSIAIRHEAVPDFRDESGKVVGMGAMTMPFALAPGVPTAGLAPGDRISFTLEMRWQEERDIARVSRIEKLPAAVPQP
jgi:Cu/Ag efflux protein CusF